MEEDTDKDDRDMIIIDVSSNENNRKLIEFKIFSFFCEMESNTL